MFAAVPLPFGTQTETKECALRGKASLERALRIASEYGEAVTDVYGRPAAALGRALGLPEHMGAIFAGGRSRSVTPCTTTDLAVVTHNTP